MKKKLRFKKRCYCSLVAVLCLFAVCSNYLYATNDSSESTQETKVGAKAPDFTVVKNGKSITLSKLGPLCVVLNFSSSSAESRKVAAGLAVLEEKYKHSDISFFDIPLDENADIAAAYGISSAPATCVINTKGLIAKIGYGDVDITQTLKDIFGR